MNFVPLTLLETTRVLGGTWPDPSWRLVLLLECVPSVLEGKNRLLAITLQIACSGNEWHWAPLHAQDGSRGSMLGYGFRHG